MVSYTSLWVLFNRWIEFYHNSYTMWRTYTLFKIMEDEGIWVRSLACSILRVERCAKVMGQGLEQTTSGSIIHMNLHKPNNKLVNAWLKHFWCMDEPQTHIDLQDSSWPRLGGKPPPSSLYYYLWLATGVTSKCHFVLKFPKLGLSTFWRAITFCANLWLKWGLKQSCSPCWEFSNDL
jgi:hypothetical protein